MSNDYMRDTSPACFVTGHRANRFHFPENSANCDRLKQTLENEIIRLYREKNIRSVWAGGARGVDMWASEIVLKLCRQPDFQDLKLYIALPFPGYNENFTSWQMERMEHILAECHKKITICDAYRPDAYKKRNYYMVDNSVCGIAVYDLERSIRSGTGMTVNYAVKKKQLPVTFIHPDTAEISYV